MKNLFFSVLLILLNMFSGIAQDRKIDEDLYKAILKNNSVLTDKLLAEGANANYINTTNPELPISMLITAVNKRNIKLVTSLLNYKADVNWRDSFNMPAIIYAAGWGNKNIVQLLIEHGADINADDGNGISVFSSAKRSKNTALINFLKEERDKSKE